MVRKYCFQIFVILNIKVILDYFADTNRELEKMKAKEKAKKGEKNEKMETVEKVEKVEKTEKPKKSENPEKAPKSQRYTIQVLFLNFQSSWH